MQKFTALACLIVVVAFSVISRRSCARGDAFTWIADPNPRGSTSYGQEFGNIIQYRYPRDDYKDLMAGVDEVLKKGYVDGGRLGVTGGGLLTNWTITQTQRFTAAVAQRDIADWYGVLVHRRLHAFPADLVQEGRGKIRRTSPRGRRSRTSPT